MSQFPDGDLSQLSSESELLKQVQENELAVKALQEAEKAQKEADKAAKDAKKAAKDAKTQQGKQQNPRTGRAKKASLRQENQGNPNPRALKKRKGEALSQYEQEREETMENNRQWLEFIEKVQAEKVQCKILEKEEAVAVLGSGDTFTKCETYYISTR
jgi:hypothetical protein